ncbi:hypothetical protein GOODEAATRI_029083 [Goodea atripinnis]|uniref:Uncharacterized protein n=1 Tax=Goodea atripinnis TaxID=208336 RepID=A0ABV0Q1Z1_9TELE
MLLQTLQGENETKAEGGRADECSQRGQRAQADFTRERRGDLEYPRGGKCQVNTFTLEGGLEPIYHQSAEKEPVVLCLLYSSLDELQMELFKMSAWPAGESRVNIHLQTAWQRGQYVL